MIAEHCMKPKNCFRKAFFQNFVVQCCAIQKGQSEIGNNLVKISSENDCRALYEKKLALKRPCARVNPIRIE